MDNILQVLDNIKQDEFEALVCSYFACYKCHLDNEPYADNTNFITLHRGKETLSMYVLYYKRPMKGSKCKRNPLSEEVINETLESMKDVNADRGMVVTNIFFSSEAIALAKKHNIALWDRNEIKSRFRNAEVDLETCMVRLQPQ